MKCPAQPSLIYRREPCHLCGAVTEQEAETKCRPTSDQTGERGCGSEFDKEGFAVAPTEASLIAEAAWIDVHHDCDGECRVN